MLYSLLKSCARNPALIKKDSKIDLYFSKPVCGIEEVIAEGFVTPKGVLVFSLSTQDTRSANTHPENIGGASEKNVFQE